jgi:hypothetical protein
MARNKRSRTSVTAIRLKTEKWTHISVLPAPISAAMKAKNAENGPPLILPSYLCHPDHFSLGEALKRPNSRIVGVSRASRIVSRTLAAVTAGNRSSRL